jgi:hypothetical protein
VGKQIVVGTVAAVLGGVILAWIHYDPGSRTTAARPTADFEQTVVTACASSPTLTIHPLVSNTKSGYWTVDGARVDRWQPQTNLVIDRSRFANARWPATVQIALTVFANDNLSGESSYAAHYSTLHQAC